MCGVRKEVSPLDLCNLFFISASALWLQDKLSAILYNTPECLYKVLAVETISLVLLH